MVILMKNIKEGVSMKIIRRRAIFTPLMQNCYQLDCLYMIILLIFLFMTQIYCGMRLKS